jgi:hypothetical protein
VSCESKRVSADAVPGLATGSQYEMVPLPALEREMSRRVYCSKLGVKSDGRRRLALDTCGDWHGAVIAMASNRWRASRLNRSERAGMEHATRENYREGG